MTPRLLPSLRDFVQTVMLWRWSRTESVLRWVKDLVDQCVVRDSGSSVD